MNCLFKTTGAVIDGKKENKCRACAQPAIWSPFPPGKIHRRCRIYGPGDYVTIWLANYGITKQWYVQKKRWLYAKLGLPEPVRCGCNKRQLKMNSIWLDAVQAYRRIRNLLGA